jgi:PAS domain S-box-containing protein
MEKIKNVNPKLIGPEIIYLQNVRRIILKVVVGFGIIAVLFFAAITITHNKLSQLSETVSAILEPNARLIKLKEISDCLYGAEANIKAYTIRRDTAYLLNYENNINYLNTRLDTLILLSSEGKIVDKDEATVNKTFSLQIDTLKQLIISRIDLFSEYIELKTGAQSHDLLLQFLQKIQIKTTGLKNNSEQKEAIQKKSFFSQLFSLSKNNVNASDSIHGNIQKLIVQTQQEEKINEGKQLSKEVDIIQREYLVMHNIFSILKRMEAKELQQGIKKIDKAAEETTAKISFINNLLTAFGLFLVLLFLYFIYIDILRTKRYRDQLLQEKRNIEKQASQYSRSLIEASHDPLVTINTQGKIMDMNAAFANITEKTYEKLIGTDFFDYFTDQQKAREVYQEVFAKGCVIDYPLTIKDGKLTDVLFNGSVYKDERGNVMGVVIVARDITEQKRFENELIEAKGNAEQATQKAEESTKLKEAFLANMSHEIRTPMNAIIGFSNILSKRNLGEQEKEFVTTINLAGENLLTIINDILDISKIEAGMMTFEKNNFSVKETFKVLHGMLDGKAKEKNLELVFSCDENVPDVLLGDSTRLTQIIINLAGNAIKFTKKGSVEVRAKIFQNDVDQDDNILMGFSVKDTGIGIPKDKLEQIFERFQQAESRTARKYGGTGLGLSIAKNLVELQGGTLSAQSEFKVGSVFSFCIPYKKSEEVLKTAEVIREKYNLEELGKLNILMAEDNQLNIKLIVSLFSEYNLKLKVAENGSAALEKLKENGGSSLLNSSFDIILMDMEMPVMNGYETTTIIRNELKNNIPIIAMTAHAMEGEREKCLSFGMNDYISKPINADLLFEKMYNLTRKF